MDQNSQNNIFIINLRIAQPTLGFWLKVDPQVCEKYLSLDVRTILVVVLLAVSAFPMQTKAAV